MSKSLTEMTTTELKQYLSANRNDDEAFSAGMGEVLRRRDPNRKPYPPDLSLEETERIMKEKIEQSEQERRGGDE